MNCFVTSQTVATRIIFTSHASSKESCGEQDQDSLTIPEK